MGMVLLVRENACQTICEGIKYVFYNYKGGWGQRLKPVILAI
jgi:hypothetical protein